MEEGCHTKKRIVTPKSNATKKPENHYSQIRYLPKSTAIRKPDVHENDDVHHVLDISGEKGDTHKDQKVKENVYRWSSKQQKHTREKE